MECVVRGPHIHTDPAGAVLTPGTEPGPVQQRGTEALPGEGPIDHQTAHINGWIALCLGRPDWVCCLVGGDRGGGYAVTPGDPGPSRNQIPADPVTAIFLAGPRLLPLVGVLRSQPLCRGIDKADDDIAVVLVRTTEHER